MTSRRLVLPLALAAALLVGCGSDEGQGSDRVGPTHDRGADQRQSDDPDRVGTDDFTFGLPEGWVETSDQVPEVALAFSSTESSGNIANNVNISKKPAPGLDVDESTDAVVEELEQTSGFEDVEPLDPHEVDGVEAAVVSSTVTYQGKTYVARQYFADKGGNRYTITFSYGLDTSDDEMVELAETVLESWTWSS